MITPSRMSAAFNLIGAIFALPMGANLPDPLPKRAGGAEVALWRHGGPYKRGHSTWTELAIIGKLEDALDPSGDPDDRQTAAEMLSQMATRQDLFANVARRIKHLQAQGHCPNPVPNRKTTPVPAASGHQSVADPIPSRSTSESTRRETRSAAPPKLAVCPGRTGEWLSRRPFLPFHNDYFRAYRHRRLLLYSSRTQVEASPPGISLPHARRLPA